MKKILASTLFVVMFCAFVPVSSDVYICISKTASKYHFDRQCRGLKQCTHTIEKVSLQEAKDKGYGLCGFED